MARIAGINVSDNKHTVIALQSIYGIGATRAKDICKTSNIKPEIKIKDVKRFGAKILQHGDNVDAALKEALSIAKKRKLSFVHPFDDPLTIAGQGTIGLEIMEALDEDVDAIFVPVGGGGLIAGVGAYIKSINPKIKIYGVEPEDAACLDAAIKANKINDFSYILDILLITTLYTLQLCYI